MDTVRMTGVILAGGEGRRLGSDKTEIVLARESLLETIITKLSTSFEEILIITSQKKQTPYADRFSWRGVKVYPDIFEARGAIAGVHSGLVHASYEYCFFAGCDMPFLNLSLIGYFKQLAPGNDAVVAQWAAGYEPLHAVYSKRCLSPVAGLIQGNNLRIYDFYPEVRLRTVQEEEITRFDPLKLSFFNINTQQALREAYTIHRSLERGENYTP